MPRLSGSLEVVGGLITSGPITIFSGSLIISGSSGSITFGTGSSTFTGNTSFSGSTTFTGSVTISGSNTFTNIGPFKQTGDSFIEGSFAQGENAQSTTIASGTGSHAEGRDTVASGRGAHAEGKNTLAAGNYSHAQGQYTTASGNYSFASGLGSLAEADYQTVVGKYNEAKSNDNVFVVGIGTDNNNRKNGLTVTLSGSIIVPSTSSAPTYIGTPGEIVPVSSSGYFLYVYMGGAWRSASLA